MDNLNMFLDLYGLAAIFIVMLAKSAGVPIPIPADALMLATSARIASGRFALFEAFVALLVALVVGGAVQFGLVRGPGRNFIYRYGRYLGLTPARLEAAAERLRKANLFGIGIAVLTPGVRSVAVIGSGLAGIPALTFIPGLALGSVLFLALHFVLGYIGGTVLNAIGSAGSAGIVIAVIVALLLIGLGVWFVIRRRQMRDATTREVLAEAVGAWHEATCPACLALGAMERLQIQGFHHEHHHD